jgi:hypothetical protein
VTRTLHVRLTASGSDVRSTATPARFLPGGSAEAESTGLAGRRLRLAAALRVGPVVDRWGAGVQERLGADAALGLAVAPRWTLEAGGAAGRILEPDGYEGARGDLRAVWHASRRVTLSAGVWTEWHRDPRLDVGGTTFTQGASAAIEVATLGREP